MNEKHEVMFCSVLKWGLGYDLDGIPKNYVT